MCFGVGELLARHFPAAELQVLPAPSVISLVRARLAWSRAEVEALSLHGRPAELLNRHLAPGARLIVLSNDGATPSRIAAMLAAQGWGPSRLWVFEHLGGPRERCSEAMAASWQPTRCAALNTVAIECRAGVEALPRARIPGLPDDAFRSDGMLTKREVRAAALARLMPLPGQCLWDVGAGSGAVAIEWLRAIPRGRAVAIERAAARCALIRENAAVLGTPELEIVEGTAPEALAGLPAPDAVFVGGGSRAPGGRLVANVVTVEGERALLDWQVRHGGELVRIEIARLDAVGSLHAWRPAMPVTQLAACKP
jgi:precorrin-6Y C5,15-methyltransferase (decarboxylating)